MRRHSFIVVALVCGVLGSAVALATVARTAPQPQRYGPPIGPNVPEDTGAGEMLVVVVGGVFDDRAEAEAANAQMVFGDLQGYYVAPVAQFQGFNQAIGVPGDFALVSAFRTDEGAREFAELARSFGHPATIASQRIRSLGGLYTGLGQEAHPDGSGPLLGPIEGSLP
jgi:hypothetical protein